MLNPPNHIKSLIKNKHLNETYNFDGRKFDREELRIFQISGTTYLCILRPMYIISEEPIGVRVDWTDYKLDRVSFIDVFHSCSEDMKEAIIFDMDNFYDKEI